MAIAAIMDEGAMHMTSKAFKNGTRIPPQYTQDKHCSKSNFSPPLEWYNVPEQTVCLALIMEDPEPVMENSPTSFSHWYYAYLENFFAHFRRSGFTLT